MRRTRSLSFSALLLAGGCNSILGIGEIHGSSDIDAAPGSVDARVDAGPFDCPPAAPDSVIGCATITHVRADGTTFKSRKDMSRYTVAAYVADASASGFHIINGTATADGVVRVDGVPDGTPYYLRLLDPQEPLYVWPDYYYTDKHDLDLGYVEIGRDETPATNDTEVTVNATAMTPWKATDALVVDSFNTGTELTYPTMTGVTAGATTVALTADWRTGSGESTFSDLVDRAARRAQLVDQGAGHGDDLWILHLTKAVGTDDALRAVTVTSIADTLQPTGVTMTDGTPVTLAGAFSRAPAVATPLTVTINLASARAAFRDQSRYAIETIGCAVSVNPGAGRGLLQQVVIDLERDTRPSETFITLTGSYTNPFPASWPQALTCTFSHGRRIRAPLGNKPFGFSYIYSTTSLTGSSVTWTPLTHAVTNLKVGGVDGIAGGAVAFDGVAPVTITWDQVPGVGHYELRIKDATTNSFTAKFDTWQSSVTMPADTFTKGDAYIFRVFAIQSPGDYQAGHFFAFEAPLWSARLSSGQFLFSKDCGNGVKDAGEDCDPGPNGSTAICDADCSAVLCGDGFVNAVASEACDDAVDAPHCDSTCKVPVCGDGHWNATIEECDDGNTIGGDGCDSQCHLEKCGDGTVDAPFEQCDDTNRINGDGCNAFCQPE